MPTTVPSPHTPATAGHTGLSNLHMFVFLCFMVLLWTLACALSHKAPDLDGMEELVWASSLELGYTKHPPFPSWVMFGLVEIFGRPVWLTFLAGQLFSALALWFLWLFGKEITSPRNAFIAVVIASTSMYFSLRGTIFNHNTAQLWSITASIWLFHRALTGQRTRTWVWLGVVSGLAVLTKYSAVIQFFAFGVFMLRQGTFSRQTLVNLGWGSLAFALTIAPHAGWLVATDFLTLRYVDNSLDAAGYLESMKLAMRFSLDQLARLSPMLVVWIAWWYWNRRQPSGSPTPLAADISRWNRSFLLWVGLTPFIATVLVSILLGTRLVASWGTTFFVLYSFFFLWLLRGNAHTVQRRIVAIAVVIHLLMAIGYGIARGPGAWLTGRDARSTFPGPEIAARMQQVWLDHVPDTPLMLVASDTWLGGNIAVNTGQETQVFINASYPESPWLNPLTALDCGALVVFSRETKGEPAESLQALFDQGQWQGLSEQRWSSERSPMIDLNWSIIPPGPQCRAGRPANQP